MMMDKLWIPSHELARLGISSNYLYKKASESRKNNRSTWITRKLNGELEVDFDSLPEPTRAKLPAREDLIRSKQAETTEGRITLLHEACQNLDWLHDHFCKISDYHFFLRKVCDKAKAEDLKTAAGWLRLLNTYKTPKQTQGIKFNSKSELRTAVVEKLIARAKSLKGQHLYGFKTTNVAVLQRRELEFAKAYEQAFEQYSNEPKIERERRANEAALDYLLHGNLGNNNRRVLGKLNPIESDRILLPSGKIDFSEWNARTLVFLFTNPGHANKYDFENIYRRYLYECKKEGRNPEVEISAVKDFLNSNEVTLYVKRERDGWAQFDKMLPHMEGSGYKYSLSKGGYDGFQVDFYSKIDGLQLMLTVVAVFDYRSGAVTGFDVGMVEDGLMVRNMYRNHLNMMGGKSYIEIESDRFSGNLAGETKAIFNQTCQHYTQPAPNDPQKKGSNPKARFVERLIQELNRLSQNYPNWKGTNITSIDRSRKPNPDYKLGKYAPEFAESMKQIIDLINIYNNDTYNRAQSRMQECLDNINPEATTIPLENIALLLNQNTVSTVTGSVIRIEVNRKKYAYDFPEYDLHSHKMMKGYKVKVYYDETDMSTIDVFGENDVYIGRLEKLKQGSRAKAEQTPEDLKVIGQRTQLRTNMIERIDKVNRKTLEFEASQLGIDISNMTLQEAQEVVAGVKAVNPEELFADALATPTARVTANYYEDRLIRSQGEAVPVSKADKKGLEEQRREYERKKFKNKNN